MTHFEKSNLNL